MAAAEPAGPGFSVVDLATVRSAAREVLATEPVIAAYLFGSVARGSSRPDSDVDVAVLFGESVPERERLPRSLRYGTRLEVAVRRPVDVVVLDDAPLRLVASVLRDRVVLHSGDEQARVAYESRLTPIALDFQLHAEAEDRAVLRRIAAEGLA